MIHPSPGHTLGSVSLLGVVDGKKVAFTGDLIHSAGKVVNLYELQYSYGSTDGVDCAIFSLTRVREQGPELICPSHGEPFNQADAGIADLIDKLKGWYSAYSPDAPLTVENKPYAVTPHLVASYQTTSSSYALISGSGKALFVDYGSASGQDGSAPFSVSIPEDWDRAKPRVAMAADVRADGQYLGQVAEGVADIEFST